jgi:predicted negative regulator of RcsB-dependent stress response
MAVTSHRKVSRKTLKQPDEFVSAVERVGDFVSANFTRLITGTAAIVLAFAAGLILSFYSQQRQRAASEQFYKAINALNDKDYRTAQHGFSTLVQTDSNRTLGRVARLYLASTYLRQGQPAKARDAVRSYLADSHDHLFRQMAMMQLGVSDEDLGDYRGAHAAYVQAARMEGPEKARAQVNAGRTLALISDRPGAIAAYQQFLRENPFSQQRPEVVEALAQLGASSEPLAKETSPAAVKGRVDAPIGYHH